MDVSLSLKYDIYENRGIEYIPEIWFRLKIWMKRARQKVKIVFQGLRVASGKRISVQHRIHLIFSRHFL